MSSAPNRLKTAHLDRKQLSRASADKCKCDEHNENNYNRGVRKPVYIERSRGDWQRKRREFLCWCLFSFDVFIFHFLIDSVPAGDMHVC